MKTVYADSLVLLNAAVDYVLLLSAGKLCALPLRRGRMLLGALWGGCYALGAVLAPDYLGLLSVKLAAGVLAVVIAFGWNRRTPRAVCAFWGVSAGFAGAVYALVSFSGRRIGAGGMLPVSPRVLAVSFALCYAGVSLVFRHIGRRAERRLHRVELLLDGRRAAFTALEDSGNELIDPVTGCAVVIASAQALEGLLPEPGPLSEPDPVAALEKLNSGPRARFRLLPCGGVTAARALLLCFTPDGVEVDGRPRQDLVAAVSPNALAPDGEYLGIIGTGGN